MREISTMLLLVAALAILSSMIVAIPLASSSSSDHQEERGVVFGLGEFSAPFSLFQQSPDDAIRSALEEIKELGATHVRLPITWFQSSNASTEIAPLLPPSPLRSSTFDEISQFLSLAKKADLKVVVSCVVDLSWDNFQVNQRKSGEGRAGIGSKFTSENEWEEWFQSLEKFVTSVAKLVVESHDNVVERVDIADGLTFAFQTQEKRFRGLIATIRAKFPSLKLGVNAVLQDDETTTRATSIIPAFFDAVDVIGSDSSKVSLGEDGEQYSEQAKQRWEAHLQFLASISTQFNNKPVVISTLGFQSRPQCSRTPWATPLRSDGVDCSAFPGCFDLKCQERAYNATLSGYLSQREAASSSPSSSSSLAGMYFWMWTADPEGGGTADSAFTPRGKPAETVLRRAWRTNLQEEALVVSSWKKYTHHHEHQQQQNVPKDKQFHGDGAGKTRNGFVFGIGEWAGSAMRADSDAALASLDNMIATTGANAVEFPITWFFVNRNDTLIYPISDESSLLRTPSDDELINLMVAAKKRGLRVCLSPMIDPTCQGSAYPEAVCYWRAEMGTGFNASQWQLWFDTYSAFILHYAEMSGKLMIEVDDGENRGQRTLVPVVDEFHVSHELVTAEREGPTHLWEDLVNKVRSLFPKGQVSVALNWGPFVVQQTVPMSAPQVPIVPDWIRDANFDYIGVDCYFPLSNISAPSLPWDKPDLSPLMDAWGPYISALQNYSIAVGGKKIVCTEVGYQSRFWSFNAPAGIKQLDTADCSVWDQCVSSSSQAMGYEALLSSLSKNDWYGGVYLWLWRADPTAGGASDDDFTPAGKKQSLEVLKRWWA